MEDYEEAMKKLEKYQKYQELMQLKYTYISDKPKDEDEGDDMSKIKFVVLPYNKYSKSAKILKESLGGVFPRRMDFKNRIVVNWGCSGGHNGTVLDHFKEQGNLVLNPHEIIQKCSNKKSFFDLMKQHGVSHPDYTTEVGEALSWAADGLVFGRNKHGHSGNDISKSTEYLEFGNSDFLTKEFWVKYIPKKHEYRVHIFQGDIIDFQRKALRKTDSHGVDIDTDNVDFTIRNLSNGFVFIRQDVELPDDVRDQSLKAFKATGLDFGAIDVIYQEKTKKAYVLEVNTAPGLEGSTVENYVNAIKNKY